MPDLKRTLAVKLRRLAYANLHALDLEDAEVDDLAGAAALAAVLLDEPDAPAAPELEEPAAAPPKKAKPPKAGKAPAGGELVCKGTHARHKYNKLRFCERCGERDQRAPREEAPPADTRTLPVPGTEAAGA